MEKKISFPSYHRVKAPEYLLSAAADFKEGKSYYENNEYDLAKVKFGQAINKISENDADYVHHEQSVLLSMERMMEYVTVQVTKSIELRQSLADLYDTVTKTKAYVWEHWPVFVYLLALHQEHEEHGNLDEQQLCLFYSSNVQGMLLGLTGDSLIQLSNCYQCLDDYDDAKSLLLAALKIFLLLYGERSYKYASTLTALETLPREFNSAQEREAMRCQLAKLWPKVFVLIGILDVG